MTFLDMRSKQKPMIKGKAIFKDVILCQIAIIQLLSGSLTANEILHTITNLVIGLPTWHFVAKFANIFANVVITLWHTSHLYSFLNGF